MRKNSEVSLGLFPFRLKTRYYRTALFPQCLPLAKNIKLSNDPIDTRLRRWTKDHQFETIKCNKFRSYTIELKGLDCPVLLELRS